MTSLNLDDYLSRSKHISDPSILNKQIKKYKSKKSPPPSYYGIFVDYLKNNVDFKKLVNPKQNTPLHITCALHLKNNKIDTSYFGMQCELNIIGLNNNKAGRCALVELNEEIKNIYCSESIPHITLETYNGFKPVDVGKNISSGETTPLSKFSISGIYGPIY